MRVAPPPAHPRAPRARRPALATRRAPRRAMTLLEVVLAVTLLALTAGAALTAVSFAISGQERQAQRLAAAELANRLMLQHLDDEGSMPDGGSVVRYAALTYRWEIDAAPLRLTPAVTAPAAVPTGPGAGANRSAALDRLRRVSIRVWLSEESGGARTWEVGVPGAVLTRMVDPMAFRNPDSFANTVGTEEGIRRLMQQMMGGAPPPPRGNRTPRSDQPRTEPPR